LASLAAVECSLNCCSTRIDSNALHDRIVGIDAMAIHIRIASGEVYAWGWNEHSMLGLTGEKEVVAPRSVTSVPQLHTHSIQLAAGGGNSAYISGLIEHTSDLTRSISQPQLQYHPSPSASGALMYELYYRE